MKTTLKLSLIILTALVMVSSLCHAEYAKCEIDGVLVYSDTKCNSKPNAEKVIIDPAPRDSADNPNGAVMIQMRKQAEQEMELRREQLQLQREQAQAQYDLQRQQMRMQQDLVDKSQGIGTGALFGQGRLNDSQLRVQTNALKSLKAINGVVDIPEHSQTNCNSSSYTNPYGYGNGRTVCK